MRLALFDLDNTLLAGDSDFEWAQFLIEQGVLDREVYEARNLEFYEQYKAGTLDIHEFLDFQLKPLSRHDRAVLDAWHREFMARKIIPIITRCGARPRAETRGDLCVIVTATNSFVTAPIAREFGIEHLIATEPEENDGEFTGGVRGTPSFPRRQGRARASLARGTRAGLRCFRPFVVLQRFAQRSAAARAGHRSRSRSIRTRSSSRTPSATAGPCCACIRHNGPAVLDTVRIAGPVLNSGRPRSLAIGALFCAAAGASLATALLLGSLHFGVAEVWDATVRTRSGVVWDVVWNLRAPRALAAFACGGLLALAGALLQVLLRNPLADPYVLGISSGASLGALAAIALGLSALSVNAAAFSGALAAIVIAVRAELIAAATGTCTACC